MKAEDEFSKVAGRVSSYMKVFDRGCTIVFLGPIHGLVAFPPQFPNDLLRRMQSIEQEEYRRMILETAPNTEMDLQDLKKNMMEAAAIREAKESQKKPKNKYQFIDGIYGRNNRREQCR